MAVHDPEALAADRFHALNRTLQSIDANLKLLVELALDIDARGKPKAMKVDLDSQHGDPIVKAKDPRDWTGDPMIGRKFSECPPEYLDMVADRLDYFASREEDAKKKNYNLLDAARARGWAARIRAGYKPPAQPDTTAGMVKEDEVAF